MESNPIEKITNNFQYLLYELNLVLEGRSLRQIDLVKLLTLKETRNSDITHRTTSSYIEICDCLFAMDRYFIGNRPSFSKIFGSSWEIVFFFDITRRLKNTSDSVSYVQAHKQVRECFDKMPIYYNVNIKNLTFDGNFEEFEQDMLILKMNLS